MNQRRKLRLKLLDVAVAQPVRDSVDGQAGPGGGKLGAPGPKFVNA